MFLHVLTILQQFMGANSKKYAIYYAPQSASRVLAMFARLFLTHPRSVGESYFEHQRVAISFAGPLLLAGFACLLHAVIPGLCERTASSRIERLHARLLNGQRQR